MPLWLIMDLTDSPVSVRFNSNVMGYPYVSSNHKGALPVHALVTGHYTNNEDGRAYIDHIKMQGHEICMILKA